jgi:hypothetical protein
MILLPNHERGTIILAELPYSLAIAVTSDTRRVELLFGFIFIIHLYNHPQLYTFRLVIPVLHTKALRKT